MRNSYSAHAVGFAESAPGCTFCTDLRGLLSANGIPSLAPSICILFPFHAFSNLFISAISQMLRLWRFATSRSICTTIIRIKNFLLFVKGCRCFCSACAEYGSVPFSYFMQRARASMPALTAAPTFPSLYKDCAMRQADLLYATTAAAAAAAGHILVVESHRTV